MQRMVDLEYRIGGLDPENPTALSKFIVHREDDRTLGIYALDEESREFGAKHWNVVKYFNLDRQKVLGGGNYNYFPSSQEIVLDDWSSAFGSIPLEVAQKVGETLTEHFRRNGIAVKNIRCEMKPIFSNSANRDAWISLGFDVPNPN